MIEEMLPTGVVAAEAFDDLLDTSLFPAEEAVIASAVEKRRREFTTGRYLARRALAGLGVAPAALLPGPRREPVWPAGVVGSITHCPGYRAAVVARQSGVTTIGIDAEPDEPLPRGVLDAVSLPQERDRLGDLRRADPRVHWDRLLFSVKESVYKAWYPLARRWLDFAEAEITIDPDTGEFQARLLVPGPALPDGQPLAGFSGRWLSRNGLLLSVICVPAAAALPVAPAPSHEASAEAGTGSVWQGGVSAVQ